MIIIRGVGEKDRKEAWWWKLEGFDGFLGLGLTEGESDGLLVGFGIGREI